MSRETMGVGSPGSASRFERNSDTSRDTVSSNPPRILFFEGMRSAGRVHIDPFVFDGDERGCHGELRLRFETLSRFDPAEKSRPPGRPSAALRSRHLSPVR